MQVDSPLSKEATKMSCEASCEQNMRREQGCLEADLVARLALAFGGLHDGDKVHNNRRGVESGEHDGDEIAGFESNLPTAEDEVTSASKRQESCAVPPSVQLCHWRRLTDTVLRAPATNQKQGACQRLNSYVNAEQALCD